MVVILTHAYYHNTNLTNLHFAIIQQHAIHFFNGSLRRLLSLKVHKAIAFRAILITNHLK